MKKILPLSLSLVFIFGIIGCGKEQPTDKDKVNTQFKQNEWFTHFESPSPQVPSLSKKGDTPIWVTRKPLVPVLTATTNITTGAGTASVAYNINWPDTLVVVYLDSIVGPTQYKDTIYKPTPKFNGDLNFYYKLEDTKWVHTGLTPGKIVSDSADGYVGIDSIQIEVVTGVDAGKKPTITSDTEVISADPLTSYPYIFKVGDSIKITVYKSGSLSDSLGWVFLHTPLGDRSHAFNYVSHNVWSGTWYVGSAQHHWVWVDVFDVGAILYKNQKAERDFLWGIPYKVE